MLYLPKHKLDADFGRCVVKLYTGQLKGSKATEEARRAYRIYQTQKSKCGNPKVREYKYYGARGIRVMYSAREFVSWWIFNIERRKWKSPTTGRIDHSGHYSLDNIVMQERGENCAEAWTRLGQKHGGIQGRPVVMIKNGKRRVFKSSTEAAKFLGIDQSNVSRFCRRELKPKDKNLIVRYMDDLCSTSDASS
jgi:hypothetical protein